MTRNVAEKSVRSAAILQLRARLDNRDFIDWHDALQYTARAMLGCQDIAVVALQEAFVEAIKNDDFARASLLIDEMEKAPRKADAG